MKMECRLLAGSGGSCSIPLCPHWRPWGLNQNHAATPMAIHNTMIMIAPARLLGFEPFHPSRHRLEFGIQQELNLEEA